MQSYLWLWLGSAASGLLVAAIATDNLSASSGQSGEGVGRLRPRYLFESVDVRGSTFHRHRGKPIDLKLRDAIKRRVERAEDDHGPKFVARRDSTTEQQPKKIVSLYKAIGGSSRQGLPTDCQRCTIVGNAGTLKGSGLGWVADASDCVFRLGMAPTSGYEEDVGSSTTLRVLDSESFGDLLRRPMRLTTGPLASDTWLLYEPHKVDPLKVHLKLGNLPAVTNLTILTLTQAGETATRRLFKQEALAIGYKLPDTVPSTLWHAVQAATDSGCTNIQVLGVPGPKFCKQHANSVHGQTPSRYWGAFAPSLCSRGKDWGLGPPTSPQQVMTLADRRALKGWANNRSGQVTFMAPTWSLLES